MTKQIGLFLLFLGGLGGLNSCTEIDCPVTNGVLANYVVQGDTLRDTLTVSAIRENKTDTVLLNRLALCFYKQGRPDDCRYRDGRENEREPFRKRRLFARFLPYTHFRCSYGNTYQPDRNQ